MIGPFTRRKRRRHRTETLESVADLEEPPLSEHELAVRRRLAELAGQNFFTEPHARLQLDVHQVNLGRGKEPPASLVFLQGGHRRDTDMQIRRMEVMPELQRRGIGSLLLIKSVQYGMQYNPAVKTVSTAPVGIGMVRVMQRVFGEDNVSLPPEASLQEGALREGLRVEASIDRDYIESIDVNQKLQELAETGRVTLPGRGTKAP